MFLSKRKKNEVLKRLTALRIIATEGDNKNAEDFAYMIDNIAEITGIIGGEKALSFLTDYLLGENWYVVDPISPKQVNTNRVHEILWKYSKKYRKEYKQYRKQKLRERD